MTLEDLVQEVTEWHYQEYGTKTMDKPIGNKLREEACEFRDEVCLENKERAKVEAADCLILLCAWAGRNGIDLIAEARKKFDIVRNRNQRQRDIERGIIHEAAGASNG